MKIPIALLSTLIVSAGLISAISVPKSYIPAHGNAEYGPADPLTLARRVEAFRQSIYGGDNLTTQSTQSTQSSAPEQAQIEDSSAGCGSNCKSTLSFAGSATKAFEVGNKIPGINFKTRNSWAGNLPIAKSTDRELYFWLWGAETPSDDLVIWLNGGPGCSSLYGFLTENGVVDYQAGKSAATDASKTTSWTTLANMLYIEQPVGTGFTVGKPYAKNEDDMAAGFVGFLENFYKTFPELKSKKLWITGESYAGTYIPYIATALYKAGNKHNLQGVFIIDGVITSYTTMNYLVTTDYIKKFNDQYLHLSQGSIDNITALAKKCGYGNGKDSYVSKHLNYPPKGPLPSYNEDGCGVWDEFVTAALKVNPAFSFYNIAQTKKPNPPSVLGDPLDPKVGSKKTFFDNKELQAYIHAPNKKWNLCNDVFPNGDPSLPPDQINLAYMIEQAPSKRNVIANGDLDALVMTDGVALSLQNTTWNGKRGFNSPPSANKFIDSKGKWAGGYVTERGLSFAVIEKSGHELPRYAPYSGLKMLSYLLGKTASLGA